MTIPNFSSLQSFLRMENSRLQMLCLRNFHMPLSIFFSFSFAFISRATDSYASEVDPQYAKCSLPFTCGQMLPLPTSTGNITYPFWENTSSYCGVDGFGLECQEDDYISMDFNEQRYRVLNIDYTNRLMSVARNDLWDGPCTPSPFLNTTMNNNTLFHYTSDVKNVSIFYCLDPHPDQGYKLKLPDGITCQIQDHPNRRAIFIEEDDVNRSISEYPGLNQCDRIKVPVPQRVISEVASGLAWKEVLRRGFQLTYTVNGACSGCQSSGGACGSNSSSPQNFACYCSDQPYPHTCLYSGKDNNIHLKVGIGVSLGVSVFIVLIALILYCRHRNTGKKAHSYTVSRSFSSSYTSRTDLDKSNLYHGLAIFDYNELQEATNNFDPQKELGEGGFGTVYFGKLRDGRSVAVKRLYENSYKRVEQFMNEVEILSRLRHPNLVILYGCTSRQSHRLLLVYEYVPNGTVADHLHGNLAKPGSLSWSTRLNIAIETASALVYLHATDIIHRDVKTNNILLDENFSVKVADFGLSRLFPFNVTHVSTAPQGTPGYVDPEYHQCYQLTEKSDVYSFGVVLMELLSSLPAVDITRHRHEINLSTMAINRIHNQALHEIVDPHLGFNSNDDTRNMITAVGELGFQCLQSAKDMRPSMSEVLIALKDIRKMGMDENNKSVEKEDTFLLKNVPSSPNSVMAKFHSVSTTPNASS